MRKRLSAGGLATLILGLATFLWLLFHVYEIRTDLPGVLRFEASDFLDVLVGAGYLVMLLFHAAAFLFLFGQVRRAKRFAGWPVLGLVTGVVSLFAIAAEKVMYDEISREMAIESPFPDEVFLLYGCLAVNLLFSAVMMAAAFRTLLRSLSDGAVRSGKDECVFILAQLMGVVSGVMGLALTSVLIARGWPTGRFWIFIPFYALFMLPYGLAVFYWLVLKWREKPADWYDEKQVRDMMKASLATLILSIPALAVLAFAGRAISFYWFPFYLFFVMTVFSTGTYYYFKRS